MTPLEHFHTFHVRTDLYHVPHGELLLGGLVEPHRISRSGDFGQDCRIERPPVATAVGDDYIMVFVDPNHGPDPVQTLEHPVSPTAVSVLQRLHDFKFEIHVDLIADLQPRGPRAPRPLLAQAWQMISIHVLSLCVIHHFQIRHPFESHAVQILRPVVPHHVRRRPGARGRPVLDLLNLAAPAVAPILVFPLPVNSPNDASPGKDAANRNLFAFASGLEKGALAARSSDAVKAVAQLVLVSVVAHGAEVVIAAFGAFPADSEDGLLATSVAHGAFVFDTSWGTV